jgi:hypothetical protein
MIPRRRAVQGDTVRGRPARAVSWLRGCRHRRMVDRARVLRAPRDQMNAGPRAGRVAPHGAPCAPPEHRPPWYHRSRNEDAPGATRREYRCSRSESRSWWRWFSCRWPVALPQSVPRWQGVRRRLPPAAACPAPPGRGRRVQMRRSQVRCPGRSAPRRVRRPTRRAKPIPVLHRRPWLHRPKPPVKGTPAPRRRASPHHQLRRARPLLAG